MELRDVDATHNLALRSIIFDRIRSAGPISFAEFYELALYHPRHGYYFTSDPTQDYQSSPSVHPAFGAAIARQLAAFWRALDRPSRFDVFEAGAGSGRLATDILRYLNQSDREAFAAIRYVIQDVALASESDAPQVEALDFPPDKLTIATDLPSAPVVDGCILSNELLDALPFRRVRVRDSSLLELWVGLEDGELADVEVEARPETSAYFDALGLRPGEGCDAEVNLAAPAWTARAANALRRGFLLTLDYGDEASELYAPWRKRGTLLTFYRQSSGEDPYARIGRQDITASVDFTTVRRAGESAGLETLAFEPQSRFLARLGIAEALHNLPQARDIEAFFSLRRAVTELTDPAGLGRIKVLVQGKGVPDPGRLGP